MNLGYLTNAFSRFCNAPLYRSNHRQEEAVGQQGAVPSDIYTDTAVAPTANTTNVPQGSSTAAPRAAAAQAPGVAAVSSDPVQTASSAPNGPQGPATATFQGAPAPGSVPYPDGDDDDDDL